MTQVSPVFPSRTNVKLHNILVTPNMVKEGHNEPSFAKGIWSWLYSSGDSKELCISNPCIQLHPAPSTSIHLGSASTQLSAAPSTIFEPKYCT